ncbi:MAG: hypothetical protein HKO90_02475 [Flavobacteriaceae bacterium]|nr:hypothetical protein [Flavobacteriaceae bacterium]
MKNLCYALLLIVGTFFSCSVEEIDNSKTNKSISSIDLNALDNAIQGRSTSYGVRCFNKPLIDVKGDRVGWLSFLVSDHEVSVTYRFSNEYSINETRLTIEAWSMQEVDYVNSDIPQPKDFPYATDHGEGADLKENLFTYTINKTTLGKYSRYAAFAEITDAKGQQKKIWAGAWASYMLADFSYCGTWPEEEVIRTVNDVEFFAPLSAETSGSYPYAGSHSETVTVTNDKPLSEGYVDIELKFTDLPLGFTKSTLSIDFLDLDLHPDIIQSGENMVDFHETFTLYDDKMKQIITLNDSYDRDGDFTWTYDLPNNLLMSDELTLYVRVTASLMLMEGSGITASNTIEHIKNITLSGDVIIK